VEPEDRATHKRAHCGAKYHKHGVTILSINLEFVLSTPVGIKENKMKGPQSRDPPRKETGKEMKCRIDLCLGWPELFLEAC
jgi:hypothetical protein